MSRESEQSLKFALLDALGCPVAERFGFEFFV
jgi:hypothetical protein